MRCFSFLFFVLITVRLFSDEYDPIDYLGQTPPSTEPELFAPGISSNGLYNRDFTISPDSAYAYTSVVLGQNQAFTIMESRKVNGHWLPLTTAPFASNLEDINLEPFINTLRPSTSSG